MRKRTNKIVLKNFSFSVGELVIEQSTDETEVSMPDTALKAIGQVVSAPQQLLGIESNGSLIPRSTTVSPVQAVAVETKVRRRRRRSPATNGDGVPGAESNYADSVKALILELKREGFFEKERDAKQVEAKLHEQGHTTAKTSNIRMTLQALTKGKELYRKMDNHKKYCYQDKPYGED